MCTHLLYFIFSTEPEVQTRDVAYSKCAQQVCESMDPLKPFEWIRMVVQLATNTVQMVSPCVYKTNGRFRKWTFWMVSNGLSVGGLKKLLKLLVVLPKNPGVLQTAPFWINPCYMFWVLSIMVIRFMWILSVNKDMGSEVMTSDNFDLVLYFGSGVVSNTSHLISNLVF